MNTGKIIASLRDKKDWSQSDLAQLSNVSRVMIGNTKEKILFLLLMQLKKITDALDVSLDYLVGEGEMLLLTKNGTTFARD